VGFFYVEAVSEMRRSWANNPGKTNPHGTAAVNAKQPS